MTPFPDLDELKEMRETSSFTTETVDLYCYAHDRYNQLHDYQTQVKEEIEDVEKELPLFATECETTQFRVYLFFLRYNNPIG